METFTPFTKVTAMKIKSSEEKYSSVQVIDCNPRQPPSQYHLRLPNLKGKRAEHT